jgi:hypothetical protein
LSNAAVAPLDFPACDRTQRRRPRSLAGAQIEAGVMPRTAHAFAGYETLGQRAVIMCAMRADGEDFIAALHQYHLFVSDMAEKLAVGEIR